MPSKDWFEILGICRAMSNSDPVVPITASELARVAAFEDTPEKISVDGNTITKGSKKNQIASAWLSKLAKWKYLEISGQDKSGGKRPANIYSLTKLGVECVRRDQKSKEAESPEEKEGPKPPSLGADSKERLALAKLLDSVSDFAAKRGTKEEEASFDALLLVTEEIMQSEGFINGL